MPRPANPDLSKDWKIVLPAHLAGAVEFELLDPITKKPRYGERSRLIGHLLSEWLATRGRKVTVDSPPSEDLIKPKVGGTHPSHKTRISDSSLYDEVCTLCGATDASGDKRLSSPCPNQE